MSRLVFASFKDDLVQDGVFDRLFDLTRLTYMYFLASALTELVLSKRQDIPGILYQDLCSADLNGILNGDRFDSMMVEYFKPLLGFVNDNSASMITYKLSLVYSEVLCFRMARPSIQSSQTLLTAPLTAPVLISTKSKRRASGSFFTPPKLANLLVDELLLESSRSGILKGARIIDPSCGPGIFLVEVLERAGQYLLRDEESISVYGVDLDPVCVFLARFCLWHNFKGLETSLIAKQIVVANSLVEPAPFQGLQFDAVIGNPPWEVDKPNSREFFCRYDSGYYRYGKQKALSVQEELFLRDPQILLDWQSLNDRYREETKNLKTRFHHQGRGDANYYKYFVEQSLNMVVEGGLVSLIVPSGIYCDSGSRGLRSLFLDENQWLRLSAFENSDVAFDIHRSFKYCYFLVRKGGGTNALKVGFFQNTEANCISQSQRSQTDYSVESLIAFSPINRIVLEVEGKKTIELLEKIYSSSQYLGEAVYGGLSLQYKREFDMTIDSNSFVERSSIEEAGFRVDQFGNWLKGNWRQSKEDAADAIVSWDTSSIVNLEDIEDVYIPLYEGRMVGQFDFRKKSWIEGRGRSAVWREKVFSDNLVEPQYLIKLSHFLKSNAVRGLKTGFLAVGSDTNSRTMISSCLYEVACGNAVPVLYFEDQIRTDGNQAAQGLNLSKTKIDWQLFLTAVLNSFVFDFVIRRRMAGTNLNYFVLEECPLPGLDRLNSKILRLMADLTARLNFMGPRFAGPALGSACFSQRELIEPIDRKLARAVLDVMVLELFGLSCFDLALILGDCFNPVSGARKDRAKRFSLTDSIDGLVHFFDREAEALLEAGSDSTTFLERVLSSMKGLEDNDFERFARSPNPKGFFRVDQLESISLRQTAITLFVAVIKEKLGLDQFINSMEREFNCGQCYSEPVLAHSDMQRQAKLLGALFEDGRVFGSEKIQGVSGFMV